MSHFTPDRRSFLAGAAAVVATTATAVARDYGKNAQPTRYPDPDIVVLDKRFAKYKIGNTAIQRLHTGMLWAEGPAWNGVGRYLSGATSPTTSRCAGSTRTATSAHSASPPATATATPSTSKGRQISCEHGNRRVVRYEHNGTVTVLADKCQGKPLNAPNDVVVHPDGGIWFTDPGYGILMQLRRATRDPLEIKEAVYRIDPKTVKMEKLVGRAKCSSRTACVFRPITRSFTSRTPAHRTTRRRRRTSWSTTSRTAKKLKNGKQYVSMGWRCKGEKKAGIRRRHPRRHGRQHLGRRGWVGDGYDGVHIFAPDGTRIGLILLPEICANVCFGGPKRNRLFMTASQSLYAVYVEAIGAHIC